MENDPRELGPMLPFGATARQMRRADAANRRRIDKRAAKAGIRSGVRPSFWVCDERCGGGSDAPTRPDYCFMCGAQMEARRAGP